MTLDNKKARTEQTGQAKDKNSSKSIVTEAPAQTQDRGCSFPGAGALESALNRTEGNPSGAFLKFDTARSWTIEEDGSKSFEACGVKFFLTGDGVKYSEGDREPRRLCGPLEVVSEAVDEEGNDRHAIIEMVDKDGSKKRIIFPLSELTKATTIDALLNKGLRIDVRISQNGGPVRLIQDYLFQYPQSKRTRAIHNFGWRGEKAFIVPGKPVQIFGTSSDNLELEFVGDERDGPKYSQKGTLEEWQDKIARKAVKSSRMAFAICVAFAVPLMRLTEQKTSGIHLFGPSSRGKSTALRASCSVWAKGAADGEMSSWRTTDNGLEAVAAAHNDFPLIIDEIGQANSKHFDIQEVLYMMGNEHGKGRMGRNSRQRANLTWRTIFLSSGEISLEEFAQEQARENRRLARELTKGVRVRMASIPAVAYKNQDDPRGVFDYVEEGENTSALSRAIEKASEVESYGTAGPAFVRRLIQKIEAESRKVVAGAMTQKVEEFCRDVLRDEKDGQVDRVAKLFGLVATAGELAIEFEVLPWKKGQAYAFAVTCYQAWRAGFEDPSQEGRRHVEYLDEKILSNGRHFKQFREGVTTDESLAPCWGWQILDADRKVVRVYLAPGLSREILGDNVLKKVLPELKKVGRLLEKGKRDFQYESPMPDKEVDMRRAYVIEMTAGK